MTENKNWLSLPPDEEDRNPWLVTAMPQISPEPHTSVWIEEPSKFDLLRKKTKLFDYASHLVCGYQDPFDKMTRVFAALDKNGNPNFVSEVHRVEVKTENETLAHNLRNQDIWCQMSVAFRGPEAREALKGIPSKIFWDYLASGGNIALTDSLQTPDAKRFWLRLLDTGPVDYLVLNTDSSSQGTHVLHALPCSDDRFVHYVNARRRLEACWSESEEGRNIRVLLKRRDHK